MSQEPAFPSRLKVLLIEDNYLDVALLKKVFEEMNDRFSIVLDHVTSLRAGMERLSATEPDVVFMDLGLPDCYGLSGLTTLRAAQPGVPLIVLTGHDATNAILEAVRMGAQDYFVKHRLNAANVRVCLERLLGHAGASRAQTA